jgi:hypothetical protein
MNSSSIVSVNGFEEYSSFKNYMVFWFIDI